jgi:hypothetical protein
MSTHTRSHTATRSIATVAVLIALAALALHGKPLKGTEPQPNPSSNKHIVFVATWLPRTRAGQVFYNPVSYDPIIPASPQPPHSPWKSQRLSYARTPASMIITVVTGLTAICTILVDGEVVSSNNNSSTGRGTAAITRCYYDGHSPPLKAR